MSEQEAWEEITRIAEEAPGQPTAEEACVAALRITLVVNSVNGFSVDLAAWGLGTLGGIITRVPGVFEGVEP